MICKVPMANDEELDPEEPEPKANKKTKQVGKNKTDRDADAAARKTPRGRGPWEAALPPQLEL